MNIYIFIYELYGHIVLRGIKTVIGIKTALVDPSIKFVWLCVCIKNMYADKNNSYLDLHPFVVYVHRYCYVCIYIYIYTHINH